MKPPKKRWIVLLLFFCLGAIGAMFYSLGMIDVARLRMQIGGTGWLAPLVYMVVYLAVTMLMLPSTALNLLGGALFGSIWGTVWTSLAAILAAIASFYLSRWLARPAFERRLADRWQEMDQEIRRHGFAYMLAVRLLPILPYGLANYTAGLTSVRFRDYLIATIAGTGPGVFLFVQLGSSGTEAVSSGQFLPLTLTLRAIGLLIIGATWYSHNLARSARQK